MAAKKQPKLGECCLVLRLVLSRPVPERRPPLGLAVEPWISMSGKGTGVSVVLHIPKSKDRKSENADATYAECSFCPFCGSSLRS